ncbi:hypothetical protein BD414DRAFT_538235 [Trametes punicea]|nr:hypothetical protein BD414DRAFT_538235 [Trametes punicea]
MARPHLFRFAKAASPRFDNVRVGIDVLVEDGRVGPDSGGITLLSHKPDSWADSETWVFEESTSLVPELKAVQGCGTHWLISPSQEMTYHEYKDHLAALNSVVVRMPGTSSGNFHAAEEAPILETESSQLQRAVRFVSSALLAVAQTRIPIAYWDENDYEYVACLAHSLESGALDLSTLVWNPTDPRNGWSRERVFTAHAVAAFVMQEDARAKASGDEDVESDVSNDNRYLCEIFKFDDIENPFSPFNVSMKA